MPALPWRLARCCTHGRGSETSLKPQSASDAQRHGQSGRQTGRRRDDCRWRLPEGIQSERRTLYLGIFCRTLKVIDLTRLSTLLQRQ